MTDDYHAILDKAIAGEPINHYGVKGMKWGVRKDRSGNRVTTARKNTSSANKPASKPASKPKPKAKKRPSKPRHMTDAELRNSIDRLKLEKELKSLTASERTRGRAILERAVEGAGETAIKAVATAALTYALTVAINKASKGRVNATVTKNTVGISSVLDKKK